MKYFIKISYHGGQYHGWQRQKNVISVQEVLEQGLSKLLKEDIIVIGCGRTDAGVHASEYYAHIKTVNEVDDAFLFKINKILPPDIAIYEIFPVGPKIHAQHDARLRTYDYFIHAQKNPLINHTSTEIDFRDFDVAAMQAAMSELLKIDDFQSLCKNPKIYKTTICHLSEARITIDDENQTMQLRFTSNRFMRSMVRLMVSKVLKVGARRLTIDQFKENIRSENGFSHFDPAPPQGLHLSGVKYAFIN